MRAPYGPAGAKTDNFCVSPKTVVLTRILRLFLFGYHNDNQPGHPGLGGLLVGFAQAGGGVGAGIVVQLAHQWQQLADAAAARKTGDFIGRRGGLWRARGLAMNNFHDGEKNIVLHPTQAALVRRRLFVGENGGLWHGWESKRSRTTA